MVEGWWEKGGAGWSIQEALRVAGLSATEAGEGRAELAPSAQSHWTSKACSPGQGSPQGPLWALRMETAGPEVWSRALAALEAQLPGVWLSSFLILLSLSVSLPVSLSPPLFYLPCHQHPISLLCL